MPMGIISDEELQAEIKRNGAKGSPYGEVKIPAPAGRKEGDRNVPEPIRKVIAQDAIENGRASALELAASLGISASSVSAYTNGANSTTSYNNPDNGLRNHVNQVKQKIAGKARRRLGWALEGITQEKLQEASLKTAAAVAKDMAVIIKQMEPEENTGSGNNTNVQVVLFAPPLMNESDFPRMKAIDVD